MLPLIFFVPRKTLLKMISTLDRHWNYLLFSFFNLITLCFIVLGCESKSSRIQVLSTTGMIGDVVKNIAANTLSIHTMMPAGVDPHLYKPTHKDMVMLKEATLVFYNGLHLEGKMQEILEVQRKKKRKVLPVCESLAAQNIITAIGFVTSKDPHIWHDIQNWKAVSRYITEVLCQTYPQYQGTYQKNLRNYLDSLDVTDSWVQKKMQQIPIEKRYLITTHDAFSYYGRRYGLEVKTLLGISTQAEYGLKDVEQMIAFILDKNVGAIFFESSISSKSMETIIEGCTARGAKVAIGGELFSDALGREGSPEGSYIGMMRHNAQTIFDALTKR